jgi:3-dehydro-L-gulonate 2-dehydrogenase
VVLDLVASMMSLGNPTHSIVPDPVRETSLSQVFVAMNPLAVGDAPTIERIADEVVDSLHACRPSEEGMPVRYPGEQALHIREENRRLGLPIEPAVWDQILAM